MITNLLATVLTVLTTNTTEVLPSHSEWIKPVNSFTLEMSGVREVPDTDPDDKWIHTKIERIRTISFEFDGQQMAGEILREVISDLEVQMHRTVESTNWVVNGTSFDQKAVRWAPVSTNAPASHNRGISWPVNVVPCAVNAGTILTTNVLSGP